MNLFVKILAVIGGLLILSMITLFVIGASLVGNLTDLVEEAENYAEDTLSAYAENWDQTVILERAGPELSKLLLSAPNVLPQMSAALSQRAGALTSVEPADCSDFNIEQGVARERIFTAGCSISAISEGGALEFTINVEQRGERWLLLAFLVEGEALNRPASSAIMVNMETRPTTFAVTPARPDANRPNSALTVSVSPDGPDASIGTVTRSALEQGAGVRP